MIFFSICPNFSVFRRGPHQGFFEIFEKVEFLHDHEELGIDNGTVMFSERSPIRRRNNFLNLTQFKIKDFLTSTDLT